jgi:hypothetical protein
VNNLLIVTPTLGRSRFLDQTVYTVSKLPVPHRHVLVAPADVIPNLHQRFPNVICLPEPPLTNNLYSAINYATSSLSGWTHLTYINDDDLLCPEATKHWRSINASSKEDMQLWYGKVQLINENGDYLCHYAVNKIKCLHKLVLNGGKLPFTQQGLIVTHKVHAAMGPFDTSFHYAADMVYIAKAIQGRCKLTYTGEDVAVFRLRRGQLSSDLAKVDREVVLARRQVCLPEKATIVANLLALAAMAGMNPMTYVRRLMRRNFMTQRQLIGSG